MNLLYLAEDYISSKVHHQLCKHIVSSGKNINVTVYSVLRGNIVLNDLRPTYTDINYKTLFYHLDKSIIRYKYDFSFKIKHKLLWLTNNADIKNIDVVYAATLFSEGAVAYKLFRSKGVPYVVAVRGTDINFYLKHMVHLWPLCVKILKNASSVVFLTETIAKKFLCKKWLSFAIGKTLKYIIQPNGIEQYWVNHAINKSVRPYPRKLLFIGRFDANKNVIRLMRVVKSLEEQYKDIHLTLVGGGGNEHENVVAYCNKYPELFSYVGKIYDKDKLCDIYRSNDIFAMVSHSETFGLVYIEALSQGLPILYTRGQGIDGLLNKQIGEAVFSYSDKSVRDGLCNLMEQYHDYEPIGDDLYLFTWKHTAENIIKILQLS